MKKTKQITKRLLGMALVVAVLLTMLPVNVQAAVKSQSITLYQGEATSFTLSGRVSKVTSSNKKIVKASKNSKDASCINLTAGTTGKAVVTVKTSSGITKLKVTVKKLDFTVKLVNIADNGILDGQALFTVQNNTEQTFDEVTVTYTLKDRAGNVVVKDSKVFYDCLAKKTVWDSVYLGSSKADLVDVDASSCEVTSVVHSPNYTYKDVSSKVKTTIIDNSENSDSQIDLVVTTDNNTRKSVRVHEYILYYNAQGLLIFQEEQGMHLAPADSFCYFFDWGSITDYDHYEIVTQGYYKTSK